MLMRFLLLSLSTPFIGGFVVPSDSAPTYRAQQANDGTCVYGHHHNDWNELDDMKRLLDQELQFDQNEMTIPLTFGARQRKELEVQLLQQLEHSDDSIDALMNVWIHEAPAAIREMDAIRLFEDHCASLEFVEQSLRSIISTHPNWPEPMNRLALVLGLQGRYDEAQMYLEDVLRWKPWHFEAQHMNVLLALRRGGVGAGVVAARNSLPPLRQHKRRRAWVEHAVRQAQSRLRDELERSEQSKHLVLLESAEGESWQ